MIKTLTNLRKQEKEKFVVPKGVQDVIPITAIYDDGIFQIGKDKFSKEYLAELLADENNSLWSQVLYGIMGTDDQIVTVALSQIGNMGGEPYWSWYGFNSRVEWCACFVSWCANECGYIDAGVIRIFSRAVFDNIHRYWSIASAESRGNITAMDVVWFRFRRYQDGFTFQKQKQT